MNEPKSIFKMGQIVFLKTDPDQNERMIIGWSVRPNAIKYYVSFCEDESLHYDIELSTEPDEMKKMNIQAKD